MPASTRTVRLFSLYRSRKVACIVLADRYLDSNERTIRFSGETSAPAELTTGVRDTDITADKAVKNRKAILGTAMLVNIANRVLPNWIVVAQRSTRMRNRTGHCDPVD